MDEDKARVELVLLEGMYKANGLLTVTPYNMPWVDYQLKEIRDETNGEWSNAVASKRLAELEKHLADQTKGRGKY